MPGFFVWKAEFQPAILANPPLSRDRHGTVRGPRNLGNKCAIFFQEVFVSSPGSWKGIIRWTKNHFCFGVFLMRMNPTLGQEVHLDLTFHIMNP